MNALIRAVRHLPHRAITKKTTGVVASDNWRDDFSRASTSIVEGPQRPPIRLDFPPLAQNELLDRLRL
jgi:hypothetical protein